MKKVNSVSKIKTKSANKKVKPEKLFLGKIIKAKNKMISSSNNNKTGGTNFNDYCLDLMKLR